MADAVTSLKHVFEVAVTTVTGRAQGVRGPLRGKDFMLDDLTSGADSDGH
jgi:hypothetical protein